MHGTYVVKDLNGDGILDIASQLGSSGTYSMEVVIGNGNGTFKAGVSYITQESTTKIASGDFNGDGITDITLSGLSTSILLGNADGTFSAFQTVLSAGVYAGGVVVGDLNGDGTSDIAASDGVFGPYSFTTRVILGNGTAQSKTTGLGSGTVSNAVTTADVNRDGKLDIITADRTTNTVSVRMGNGDGTYKIANRYTTGASPTSISLDDINRDGVLDILTANEGGGSVSVLLGNRDGTFKTGYRSSKCTGLGTARSYRWRRNFSRQN